MNIMVQVISRNAGTQLAALQGQLNLTTAALARANAAASSPYAFGGTRHLSALSRFGNQLQWTGRQLQYNFTLPIVLAGAAATNFALENEKAFTRVAKVYGDASLSAETMKSELDSLRGAFEALSNHYGVHQAEVINIAADWAAAGASGVALARGVEQTLRVMVLGEMEAAAATKALISIQAQYNLSSGELVDTMAKLNVIENQTAISMQGLIEGFQRSAGVARAAGVDVDHLGAMLAALVPSAGSAAQAGNALKTIMSRILSPTKDATEKMKAMGIAVEGAAWANANGAQRIEILAQKYHGLADSQKAVVAAAIASRYQVNKFQILMDDVYRSLDKNTRESSRYATALDATQVRTEYLAQAEKELNAVLESQPQQMKQIWVILQNALAQIIKPMIPVILMAANGLRVMAEAFRDLPPEVQKAITYGLLFLALFGPMLRYIGSTMTLIGELMWFFGGLAGMIFGAVKAMGSFLLLPFKGAGTAIGGLGTGLAWLATQAGRGVKALWALVTIGPILRTVLGASSAIIFRMGTMLLGAWTLMLFRMAAVTGPMLAAVTRVFVMWQAGLIRLMTLIRISVLGGWLAIVASTKFVGPAMLVAFRSLWTGMAVIAGMGTAYIVGTVRAMWLGMVALFANWRAILVGIWVKMWAVMVAVTKGGIAAIGRWIVAGLATLVSPWTLLVVAVLGVLYAFRDQIGQLIQNVINYFRNLPPGVADAFRPVVAIFHAAVAAVIRGFNALPEGVRNALIAVVNIVASAARQVYELFSYLNPFARHSPSLVDNVTEGMAVIKSKFASITEIGGPIKAAYRDLKAFGEATKALLKGMDSSERSEQRSNLGKVAPGALDEFDKLVSRLKQLNGMLARLKSAVDSQQAVVDKWSASLDNANAKLDIQEKKLSELQKVLDGAKDSLDEAKQALQDYVDTPLAGMGAMEDQIFANEMAQKRLRLELLRMEDAGQSTDDLSKKLQALAGQIEFLSGEQRALRDAGAGSEILGVYDQEIDKLEEQSRAIQGQAGEYAKLSTELERLQRQGEILDLEKSLKFDELVRQIEKAAETTKELSFEEIMAGIQKTNAEIDKYTTEVNDATTAVNNQQKAVDAATAARDAIQARYDAEIKKLDELKDAYSKVQDTIQDITGALSDMASAASDAIEKAKGAKGGKGGGAGGGLGAAGDFPDVGGAGGLGREGGIGSQADLIDKFTQDLATKTGDLLGGFDMFGPIKKKFGELKGWFSTNIGPIFGVVGDAATQIFGGIDWAAPFRNADWTGVKTMWETVKDIFRTALDWIKSGINLFKDDFMQIWGVIKAFFINIWNEVGPEITKFKDLLTPLGEAFSNIWMILKPLVAIVGVALLGAFKLVSSVIANVLGPVLDLVVGLLKNVIKVIRGVIEFIVGVFAGDWEMAWTGIKDIVSGIFGAIWEIIKGAGKILWGIVSGIVEGIFDFFMWLYDELVGHSIIPDMVNAIIDWFKSLPGKAWEALKSLGEKIMSIVSAAWTAWTNANTAAWNLISTWFKGLASKVWDYIKDIPTKMKERATEAINFFKSGAEEAWNKVADWLRGRKDAVSGYVNNVKDGLKTVAVTAMNYFKDGFTDKWDNIRSWLGGMLDRVKSAIGSISLYSIGKSIFQSLWEGLKSTWGDIKNWLGGIGTQIKNVKGPIEKDRKLLIPEGKAIMSSLGIGLEGEWPAVQSWLKAVGPGIADAIVSGASAGVPMSLKSGSGATVASLANRADRRIDGAMGATESKSGTSYGTRYEVHFHGDIAFPGIKDSGDAEEFLLNLEAIVGG
jgi:TP901 family phage tail tape measure protein